MPMPTPTPTPAPPPETCRRTLAYRIDVSLEKPYCNPSQHCLNSLHASICPSVRPSARRDSASSSSCSLAAEPPLSGCASEFPTTTCSLRSNRTTNEYATLTHTQTPKVGALIRLRERGGAERPSRASVCLLPLPSAFRIQPPGSGRARKSRSRALAA